jgi:hypothetical protein
MSSAGMALSFYRAPLADPNTDDLAAGRDGEPAPGIVRSVTGTIWMPGTLDSREVAAQLHGDVACWAAGDGSATVGQVGGATFAADSACAGLS